MNRREFISVAGGALAGSTVWTLAARAQQGGHVPLVVVWIAGSPDDPEVQKRGAAFRDTLQNLGWTDGRNIRIDSRASKSVQITPAEAGALIALNPDVIVTTGAPVLAALHRQTKTIPIVFTLVTDPVNDGFVASLARPGGNVTGFTIFEHSFAGNGWRC